MKAVLFDMDGTLIDSEVFYYQAWIDVMKSYDFFMDQEEWMVEMSGRTVVQVFAYFQAKFKLEDSESNFYQKIGHAVAAQYKKGNAALMPGVKEVLQYLSDHDIRMAVVTSSHLEITESNLHKHNIRHFFEFLVTKEDVQATKPDPQPYEIAASRMGLQKEDYLVLEDSFPGTESAKAAGLRCWAVQSQEAMLKTLPAEQHFSDLPAVLAFMKNKGLPKF